MKTAMQELIEELRQTRDEGESEYKTAYNLAIAIANQYLEKEKEQMKLADKNGFDRSEYFRDLENVNAEYWGKQPKQFKEYYNQTFNQNK